MDQPLVCVCIPCYNAEHTIIETLTSIQEQTYPNIEIHIFDNASTDNSIKLISEFDGRIQIHRAKETTTGEENFTRCLNFGRGDYTAIYHADDLYAPEILEKEVQVLEKNRGSAGVLTFAVHIDDQGRLGKSYLAPTCLNMQKGESSSLDVVKLFKAVLKSDNFLFCPSAMIRTQVCIEEIKVWNGAQFKTSADLDVWLRLAAFDHISLINEPLLFYRVSDKQYTAGYRKKRRLRADIFLVLDHWLNKEEIKLSMTEDDMINYQKLERNDTLGCMLNAMRSGEIALAKEMWINGESLFMVRELLQIRSMRDLKFFMLSSVMKLMLLPMFGWFLRMLLLKYFNKVRL